MDDPEWKVRKAATDTLGSYRRDKDKIVMAVLDRLSDERPEVRRSAVLALGRLADSKNKEQIIKAIQLFAKDEDPDTRANTVIALTLMGEQPPDSLKLLTESINSSDETVSESAGRALRKLAAAKPAEVISGLKDVLAKSGSKGRKEALRVITSMRARSDDVLDSIVGLYESDDPEIQREVVETLVKLDQEGDHALPVIERALTNPNMRVRQAGIFAVRVYRSHSDRLIKPLIETLDCDDYQTKMLALSVLRGLKPEASKAVPAYERLTRDSNARVRTLAVRSLATIEPHTDESLEILKKALKDEEPKVRSAAIAALRRIGFDQPEKVIPILENAAKDESNSSVRRSLSSTLRSLGKDSAHKKKGASTETN